MVRRTPRTVPSRRPLQPALGARPTSAATAAAPRPAPAGGSPRPHAAEAMTTATSRQERRAANTRLPRRRPLLGHERDVLLGGALQAIAQHARQVQEDLGRDARVAELDAAEEALVHGKHFEVARRDDVGAPLGVAHEPHLAEHVAAPVLGHPPPLLAVARPALGAPADEHLHLVAELDAAHDHLAGREALELAHQHYDARLPVPETREARDRPRR